MNATHFNFRACVERLLHTAAERAAQINHDLWCGTLKHAWYWGPELARQVETAERCRRVLRLRYGIYAE